MHFFMNENWKPVVEEFGRPIIQAAYEVLFKSVRKFMNQPLEDLTIS